MAHKSVIRGDGYKRWEFKDGSVLVRQPNGALTCK